MRVNKTDFHISEYDETLKPIEFDLSFERDKDKEIGYLIEMYDSEKDTLDLHYRSSIKQYAKYERISSEVWRGKNEGREEKFYKNQTNKKLIKEYFCFKRCLN